METSVLVKIIESEIELDGNGSATEVGWNAALEWVINLLESIEEAKL
jgi:hypothetical protein